MKSISQVFTMAGLIFGMASAVVWWLSSRVVVEPITENGMLSAISDQQNMQFIAALLVASEKSAKLNRTAAALTAVSVALTTVASLLNVEG